MESRAAHDSTTTCSPRGERSQISRSMRKILAETTTERRICGRPGANESRNRSEVPTNKLGQYAGSAVRSLIWDSFLRLSLEIRGSIKYPNRDIATMTKNAKRGGSSISGMRFSIVPVRGCLRASSRIGEPVRWARPSDCRRFRMRWRYARLCLAEMSIT